MTYVEIVSILSIIFLTVLVAIFLFNYFKRNWSDRVDYINKFKKGKFFAVYVAAVPLFTIGIYYKGELLLSSFFQGIVNCMNLVILKFSTGDIKTLLVDNMLYRITIYYLFFVVLINAMVFLFSFIHCKVWNFLKVQKIKRSKAQKYIIIGNNHDNVLIYNSIKSDNKIIVGKTNKDELMELFKQKIAAISFEGDYISFIEKTFGSYETTNYVIIINSQSDDTNISSCKKMLGVIKKVEDKKIFEHLKVYVFGSPDFSSIYDFIVENSFGIIRFKNKFKMLAFDFIDKYPLSKYLPESFINKEEGTINNDATINCIFIGFGDTNKELFLASVANNEFVQKVDGKIVRKEVNYHIFDEKSLTNSKELNHTYYRYKHEIYGKVDESKYLPLPSLPSNEVYHKININDFVFYEQLEDILDDKNSMNYIIISCGKDLNNLDLSEKIITTLKELGMKNYKIFVRIKNEKNYNNDDLMFFDPELIFFGREDTVVYNYDKIDNDKFENMAKTRDFIYSLEYSLLSHESLNQEEIKKNCVNKWHKKLSQLERESNLFACLSLRSKLNLMGFDYCDIDDESKEEVKEDEYLAVYSKNFPIKYLLNDGIYKKVVQYDLDFKESLRTNLAILEHYRWNAYMLTKGIIPASIDQILNEKVNDKFTNGKNYALRRHGNITTFDGLVEFRKLVAERDNKTELDKDVIKYDYQILDDAHWMLKKCGYKLIRK